MGTKKVKVLFKDLVEAAGEINTVFELKKEDKIITNKQTSEYIKEQISDFLSTLPEFDIELLSEKAREVISKFYSTTSAKAELTAEPPETPQALTEEIASPEAETPIVCEVFGKQFDTDIPECRECGLNTECRTIVEASAGGKRKKSRKKKEAVFSEAVREEVKDFFKEAKTVSDAAKSLNLTEIDIQNVLAEIAAFGSLVTIVDFNDEDEPVYQFK